MLVEELQHKLFKKSLCSTNNLIQLNRNIEIETVKCLLTFAVGYNQTHATKRAERKCWTYTQDEKKMFGLVTQNTGETFKNNSSR